MSKKEKEELNNGELENQETSLEQIEPDLEEKEGYKKASFGEKLSLRFRKRLIASRLRTFILVVFIIAVIWGINVWSDSKNLAQIYCNLFSIAMFSHFL